MQEGRKDVERAFILWFPAEWQICIVGQIPLAKSSDPFQRVERKPSDIRSGPELIRIPPARSAIEMDLRGKRELIRAGKGDDHYSRSADPR